jgi:hypothetical protein
MTDSSQSQATDALDVEQRAESPVWRRRFLGDIHVGALAGSLRAVPGAGTAHGDKAIAKAMGEVLDRVRHSIRERAAAASRSTSARI